MHVARFVTSAVLAAAFATPALAASAGKAEICHWDANTAQVIEVSVNAVGSHIANHGDSYAALYFTDADGDGYGDAGAATDRCPNAGFVADNTDCDDGDDAVNPGADEDCADDCPCFTAADINVAYANSLAFQARDADQIYLDAQCFEQIDDHTYNGVDSYSHSTYVYFNSFSGDYSDDYWSAYENLDSGFLGLTFEQDDYDGTHYESAFCNAYAITSIYYDGTLTVKPSEDSRYVTEAQAENCKAVVRDWAMDNGMECPTITYSDSD